MGKPEIKKADRPVEYPSGADLKTFKDSAQQYSRVILGPHKRQAKLTLDKSLHLQACLDRNRTRLDKERLHERVELMMQPAGGGNLSGRGEMDQLSHLSRNHVGGYRNYAAGTDSHQGQGQ